MAARIDATAEGLEVSAAGRELMKRAFQTALSLRSGLDDHHVDVLHTARSALILMDDLGVADADLLAAALVLETRDRALMPGAESVAALGPGVAAAVAEVPVPGEAGDGLLEALLTVPRPVALLALAERLDHARHLHLRDRAGWAPEHELTCGVYAPLAGRVDPLLSRRFSWWCRTFERRLRRA